MSRKLIILNPDLKKIEDDGLDLEIKNLHLLVHGLPYVNSKKEIAYGTLVSKLELAGEKTVQPVDDHVIHFVGEHPCHKDGTKITALNNASNTVDLGGGIVINHSFSCKFAGRKYADYHEKITQYVKILLHEAQALNPRVKPKSPGIHEATEESRLFRYPDTNSTRAEIGAISAKLEKQKVGIVGVGGTGSYVLDFVAKTHVVEIHIFDGDVFLNHNAFRAPGAASLADLDRKLRKVTYLSNVYSQMRESIIPHAYNITAETVSELFSMNFVFICADPTCKGLIIEKLLEQKIPFVDVGIGVETINGALTGSVRVTTGTRDKNDHLVRRVSLAKAGENDYSLNIQVAELNALNAALAVVKWKKLSGFYHDLEKEHHSSYSINVNTIINDEIVP